MDSLNSVASRALGSVLRNGPLSQAKLDVVWRLAVGDALCRVTTVRLQPGGVVAVRPADQRWQKELKRSSPIILGRLTAMLGPSVITRLDVLGVI